MNEKLNIIYKSLKDINPYEKNPRKNDSAVDAVANSIKSFGFKVPIVIDNNNIIICGHTRYKAAKKLKLQEVPCVIANDLNEELDEILNIDMTSFGFETNFEEEEKEPIEDEYEVKVPIEPKSKYGDIIIDRWEKFTGKKAIKLN